MQKGCHPGRLRVGVALLDVQVLQDVRIRVGLTSTPAGLEGGQGESGPDAEHQQSQHLWTARDAVTLWAVRPRGPVSDGREDGPEAAHLYSPDLVPWHCGRPDPAAR